MIYIRTVLSAIGLYIGLGLFVGGPVILLLITKIG